MLKIFISEGNWQEKEFAGAFDFQRKEFKFALAENVFLCYTTVCKREKFGIIVRR